MGIKLQHFGLDCFEQIVPCEMKEALFCHKFSPRFVSYEKSSLMSVDQEKKSLGLEGLKAFFPKILFLQLFLLLLLLHFVVLN
jgi:hypothetical protein